MPDLIRIQSETQIPDLVDLAREIWIQHYVPIIGREQVDYMLEEFQSREAITDQIAHGYEYYILESDKKSVGYMAIVPDDRKSELMISKIYVAESARGNGFGRRMLSLAEDSCRERGIRTLRLTVNKNNTHSIDWYTRMGFTKTESLVQDIGNGFVMDDYRMEKHLSHE